MDCDPPAICPSISPKQNKRCAEIKFDETKSNLSKAKTVLFIQSPVQESLLTVPGIGPASEKLLKNNGVDTTYQLMGKYLSLRHKNMSSTAHLTEMVKWLAEIGISQYRSCIAKNIAEKVNTFMPGIYECTIDLTGDDD